MTNSPAGVTPRDQRATGILRRPAGSGADCKAILADLPDWFGLEKANADYEKAAQTGPAWIGLDRGEPVAIMLLKRHEAALEITLLAVRRSHRGGGIGRRMVEAAEKEARAAGATFLTAKTLGPSAEYPPYAETRAFWRGVGFTALEEFATLWDADNPCLFMARPLP